MRHARGRKLESGVQKNRSIKPKIRWKAKGLPDVWQGQHQVLEVQQEIISCSNRIKMVQKPRKIWINNFNGACLRTESIR